MVKFRKGMVWLFVAIFLGAASACAPTQEHRGTGEFVDDASINARVKTALLKAEGLKGAAEINVNTYRGEVQLSGFVDNDEMMRRAAEAARTVSGVTVVRNDLRIAPRR